MKNPTLWIIVAAIALIGGSLFWKINRAPKATVTPTASSSIILYYGDTCSHCKLVEDFINKNKIKEKVTFTEKEIFNNEANAKELGERAVSCKLDTTNGIPVPFLWDGQKCILGDVDVIAFFKQKAGI